MKKVYIVAITNYDIYEVFTDVLAVFNNIDDAKKYLWKKYDSLSDDKKKLCEQDDDPNLIILEKTIGDTTDAGTDRDAIFFDMSDRQ